MQMQYIKSVPVLDKNDLVSLEKTDYEIKDQDIAFLEKNDLTISHEHFEELIDKIEKLVYRDKSLMEKKPKILKELQRNGKT